MGNVYKYLSPNRISYFKDELLRFTQPADLNDPLECAPALSEPDARIMMEREFAMLFRAADSLADRNSRKRARAEIEERMLRVSRRASKDSKYLSRRHYEVTRKTLSREIGIFSVSRRWDSSLMWAHYADSHRGLCVGFNRRTDFFQGKAPHVLEGGLKTVEYSTSRIKLDPNPENGVDPRVIFLKSRDWHYEEEERLIARIIGANYKIEGGKHPLCLFNVPHCTVSEVVVGIKAESGVVEAARKFCKKNSLNLYVAEYSPDTFNMERRQVSV